MKGLFFLIPILLIDVCFAQVGTQKDYFPLEVGYKWKYSFSSDASGSMTHTSSSDAGKVEYEITGKSSSAGTTNWNFIQRRNFLRSSYYGYEWHYQQIIDSTNFSLVEILSGDHELYSSSYDQNSAFPFKQTSEDSSKFYRYMPLATPDNFTRKINYPDPSNPGPLFNYKFVYQLKSDTGIVKLNMGKSTIMSSNSTKYTLEDFRKIYDEPRLVIPYSSIQISVLFGIIKDTTFIIRNDGKQNLIITNVTSSNPKITILDYSKNLSAISSGFIKLRFYTNVEESITSKISVTCNSANTNNSIQVIATGYQKAQLQLSPASYINLGSIYNGELSFKTFSITNKGNAALKIDSIRINNSVFTSTLNRTTLDTAKTIVDTIYFSPKTTNQYYGVLKIYSNALLSPHSISLQGTSSEEIKYTVNISQINFGQVAVGNFKDTTITIKNIGKENVMVTFKWKSNYIEVLVEPFNFINPDIIRGATLTPGSTFTDVLRFTPLNNSKAEDQLVVRFMSPYSTNDKYETISLLGNESLNLSQNYPNPFSQSTSISFELGEKTIVTLKIFDILGREVGTLVNEELLPGKYEKTFNKRGLSSGIYIYQFRAGNILQIKKMVLLK